MISTAALDRALADAPLGSALPAFRAALAAAPDPRRHGDAAVLQAALEALPPATASSRDLTAGAVRIGRAGDLGPGGADTLTESLMALHPWRKGPFDLMGVHVDSEWRSDLKWARVADAISPLAGRLVLDVGCGNGYYLWRMLGAGARFVLGVDPAVRCLAQFLAVRHYAPDAPALLLPLGSEQLPAGSRAFDTVFSMGVIYHRRDPQAHLAELRGQLRPGGELVLETLVVPGEEPAVLHPAGRYAKMRNVWCIPTPAALLGWIAEAGFGAARIVDVSPTTVAEQRRTAWMHFESLADFLDPQDPSRTVEGHPAPVRAVATATLET